MLSATDLWDIALKDAGLDAQRIELFVFEGRAPSSTPAAVSVPPGRVAWEEAGQDFPFSGEDQERSLRAQDRDEILIFTEEPYVLLAILRHELEHVLQNQRNPFLLHIAGALSAGLRAMLGEGSPAFRALYASLATERAADAAGRNLALRQFGPPTARHREGRHSTLLFDDADGPSVSQLPIRMLGLLALMPAPAVRACVGHLFPSDTSDKSAIDTLADGVLPNLGPQLFDVLARNPALDQLRAELGASIGHYSLADVRLLRLQLRRIMLSAESLALSAASWAVSSRAVA